MSPIRAIVALLLSCLLVNAKGNEFNVRYNGGSVATNVSPHDWDNRLTITPEKIVIEIHDKEHTHFEIPSKTVTSLSYGQEAHRRVGTMIALAILVAPVALFGLFHKTRLHFIGIQYTMLDGKSGGILLQGDKSNYRAVLTALQGVTGAPVSVSDKEREYIPVGLTTSVTKEPADAENSNSKGGAPPTAAAGVAPAQGIGTVAVATTPNAADVMVDGQFYGNTPATLKLKPGKHTITVKMTGYKDWSRDLTVEAGSDVHLTATLEK